MARRGGGVRGTCGAEQRMGGAEGKRRAGIEYHKSPLISSSIYLVSDSPYAPYRMCI